MSAVINISISGSLPYSSATPPSSIYLQPVVRPTANADGVEFPRFREALGRAVERSSFRLAKIRAVRTEIEAGIYETPERISGTVERLLDVIA